MSLGQKIEVRKATLYSAVTKVVAYAGSHVVDVASDIVQLAIESDSVVEVDFNGITLIADPSALIRIVTAQYDDEMSKRKGRD